MCPSLDMGRGGVAGRLDIVVPAQIQKGWVNKRDVYTLVLRMRVSATG